MTCTACQCPECVARREMVALLLILMRADAVSATTKARKWEQGQGESLFRKMMEIEKEKSQAMA